MSFLCYQSGIKTLGETEWVRLPANQYGTWNLYWCNGEDGHYNHNEKMNKYDEPNPHWCSCNNFGKWKDSTISSPKYHAIGDFVNWDQDASPCQCHGTRGHCVWPNLGEMESITCHL